MRRFLSLALSALVMPALLTAKCFSSLANDCTLFASASGNDANSGTTPGSPKTLTGAASIANPGTVVCLEGGTYNITSSFSPPQSGAPAAHIQYEGYNDSPAVINWVGKDFPGNWIINGDSSCANGSFCGLSYIDIANITLNGNNVARAGVGFRHGHHITVKNMFIENTGLGIMAIASDYITVDNNQVWHTGYDPNLTFDTSGISLNANCFYDSYPGLHNVVSNNVVSGTYDAGVQTPGVATDGNGLTYDLSCGAVGGLANANSPPALFVNNVAYMNGGRCFEGNSSTNVVLVNNTCYKNMLENIPDYTNQQGEMGTNGVNGYWFINNIVVGWPGHASDGSGDVSYQNVNGSINVNYYNNSYLTLGLGNLGGGSASSMYNENPLFINPPSVNNSTPGQYANAPSPATVQFYLQASSPVVALAIDPANVAGLSAAIAADLRTYVYQDIGGVSRPQGGGYALGAYQLSAPAAPTSLTAIVH
jgi:hypothetical protein